MSQTMQNLIDNYISEVRKVYGVHTKQIILYGSYARGDFNEDSDVDVMILVDLPEERISDYADSISEIEFEYNLSHDIWFMPIVKNIEHFNYWSKAYPFYSNIVKEGILLYDAA